MNWIDNIKVGDKIIIRKENGFIEELISNVSNKTEDGKIIAESAVFTNGIADLHGVTYKLVEPTTDRVRWIEEHQTMPHRTLKEECLEILKDFKDGHCTVMSWDEDYNTGMFDREDRILWTQQRLQKVIELIEKEM